MKITIIALALASLSFGAKTGKVNVNTAPADSLGAHLPGVGPSIAANIVAVREEGKFSSCADLEQVKGLGPKKVAKLCPNVEF